ncbi:MAG: heavy-metal-associated domain-containing protein [Gallionellaceae bacterium]
METIQLNIHGMSCNGCVSNVSKVLRAVPGVSKVEVSLEQKHAIVTYDPAQAGITQLKAAVEDAGYDVV